MGSTVVERVRSQASTDQLWTRTTRVVAAASGGSDSVALACVLRELAARGELVLAGLAHLHHHIRGADADADAAFCRALAERLGVPAIVGDADVPRDAAAHGVSLEVAGRHARQAFFEEARLSMRADVVAVAHTRDDQAETVLLRLTRGAGGAGLGAMQARRDFIVRPLLDVTHYELQQYLIARGETWREDASNADRTIPRNRIRHEVMPVLRSINAQADKALARAAEILRGDEAFLEGVANLAFMKSVITDDPRGVVIDGDEFRRLPVAIARRVARYALETANPDDTYGLEEVDATVERFRAGAVLLPRSPVARTVRSVEPIELPLDIPGTVESPRGAWTLVAEGPMATPASLSTDPRRVMVDASDIGSRLVVRHRRPGDWLRPLGAPGRKKVQDVLVDRKVPRDDRDALPIVTTEKGDIVWLAGHVLADRFRVTPLTRSVVVLTLRR